jgi:hypothetical protein
MCAEECNTALLKCPCPFTRGGPSPCQTLRILPAIKSVRYLNISNKTLNHNNRNRGKLGGCLVRIMYHAGKIKSN